MIEHVEAMQKDLKEWKKELQEEGYEIKFSGITKGIDLKIIVKKEEKVAQIIIHELGKGDCFLRFDKRVDRELTFFLIEQMEKQFKNWGVSYIGMVSDYALDLAEQGYVFWKNLNRGNGIHNFYGWKWYKSIGKEYDLIKFLNGIADSIKVMQKENENLVFRLYEDRVDKKDIIVLKVKTFYQEESLYILREEEIIKCRLPFSNEEKEVHWNDFPDYIKEWINKNEKRNKMENLFDKKHPYLHEFLRKIDFYLVGKEVMKKVSELLTQKQMRYEEIEKIARERIDSEEEFLTYKKGNRLVTIIPFQSFFMGIEVEKKNYNIITNKMGIYENKEQAKRMFEETVTKWSIGRQRVKILDRL